MHLDLGEVPLTPYAALVLYREEGDRTASTVFPLLVRWEGDTLSYHKPTQEALAQFAGDLLGTGPRVRWLHPRVVAEGPTLTAWWRPAGRQVLHLDLPSLKDLSGRAFPLPPLAFIRKEKDLWVFALPKDERPGPDTPLYHAPFFNWREGVVCWGSGRVPQEAQPEEWEAAFFESAFSHTWGNPLKRGTLPELYRRIAGKRSFPMGVLKKAGLTLGEALKRLGAK